MTREIFAHQALGQRLHHFKSGPITKLVLLRDWNFLKLEKRRGFFADGFNNTLGVATLNILQCDQRLAQDMSVVGATQSTVTSDDKHKFFAGWLGGRQAQRMTFITGARRHLGNQFSDALHVWTTGFGARKTCGELRRGDHLHRLGDALNRSDSDHSFFNFADLRHGARSLANFWRRARADLWLGNLHPIKT